MKRKKHHTSGCDLVVCIQQSRVHVHVHKLIKIDTLKKLPQDSILTTKCLCPTNSNLLLDRKTVA